MRRNMYTSPKITMRIQWEDKLTENLKHGMVFDGILVANSETNVGQPILRIFLSQFSRHPMLKMDIMPFIC